MIRCKFDVWKSSSLYTLTSSSLHWGHTYWHWALIVRRQLAQHKWIYLGITGRLFFFFRCGGCPPLVFVTTNWDEVVKMNQHFTGKYHNHHQRYRNSFTRCSATVKNEGLRHQKHVPHISQVRYCKSQILHPSPLIQLLMTSLTTCFHPAISF